MNRSDLSAALDVLSESAKLTEGFHPEHRLAGEAAQMHMVLSLAALYVADLAKQLHVKGLPPTEAVLAVLEGERPLQPETVAALKEQQRLPRN